MGSEMCIRDRYTGVLRAFDAGAFTLELPDGRQLAIPRKDAAQVKPYIEF